MNYFVLIVIMLCSIGWVCTGQAQFIINGSASGLGAGEYLLTPDQGRKVGSIWSDQKVSLNQSFEVEIELYFGSKDASGADGITFSLQPNSNTVGTTGQGLGIGGTSPSFITEMDTYFNGNYGDPLYDHIALLQNTVNHSGANNLVTPKQIVNGVDNVEDGTWYHFKASWDASNKLFQVWVNGSQRILYQGDIVNTVFNGDPLVYWGFTGSTGGLSNEQKIRLLNTTFIDLYECTETPANKTFCDDMGAVAVDLSIGNIQVGATYTWYDAPYNGNQVATGTSFTTPPLTESTTYYVLTNGGATNGTVGPTPTSTFDIWDVNYLAGYNRKFTTEVPLILKSVELYHPAWDAGCGAAGTTKSVTIDLYKSGSLYASKNVAATCGGAHAVTLDFNIDQAGDYELRIRNIAQGTFEVNSQGQVFNIPGVITLLNNTVTGPGGTNTYSGPFFNWVIEAGTECLMAVDAIKACPPCDSIPVDLGQDFILCADQDTLITANTAAAYVHWSSGETSKTISVSSGNYTIVAWDDERCKSYEGLNVTSILCDSNTICNQDVDYNTWMQSGISSSGLWTVAPDGKSVVQTVNDNPTFFVGTDDHLNVKFSGKISVNDNDDDWIGMVFGYTNPTLVSNYPFNFEAVVFSWKQFNQTINGFIAQEGFSLFKVNANISNVTDLRNYLRANPSAGTGLEILATNYGAGLGWLNNVEYILDIEYTSSNIKVYVNDFLVFDVDGCFNPGKIGFYNDSQPNVTYSNFNYNNVASIALDQDTICAGYQFTASASGGATCGNTSFFPTGSVFSWNFGDGTTATGTTVAHTYDANQAYEISMTMVDAYGCSHQSNKSILVEGDGAIVNLGPDTAMCGKVNMLLNAGSGWNTYAWNTGATTQTIHISANGTYAVEVSSIGGCTASDEIIVATDDCDLIAQDTITICLGESATITVTGFETIIWAGTETFTIINDSAIEVSPTNTATYIVTNVIKNENFILNGDFELPLRSGFGFVDESSVPGWSTTATDHMIEIWVNGFLGTPSYSGNQFIELNAHMPSALYQDIATTPGAKLQWGFAHRGRNGVDVMKFEVGPPGGPYTTIGTFSDGQSWGHYSGIYDVPAGQTTTRFHYTAVSGVASGNLLDAIEFYTIIEQKDTVVVISRNVNVDLGSDTSICAGDSVTINAGNTGAAYAWSTEATTESVRISNNGTYTVTVTSGSGCSGSDQIAITVHDIPFPDLNDTLVCAGNSTVLSASGGDTFSWSNGETTSFITITADSTSTYTVTASSQGCSATDEAVVLLIKSPVTVTGDTICNGDTAIAFIAAGADSYIWNTGDTNNILQVMPNASTNYTVSISLNGCSASGSVAVLVKALPEINFSGRTAICYGDTTALTATGGGSYTWNGGSTDATLYLSPGMNASYTLTVTNNGCTSSDEVAISVTNVIARVNDAVFCEGSDVTLSASGGDSYSWSNGATTANITLYPAITNVYTVTATANGCSAMDTAVVTILKTPVSILNDTICNGEQAVLTVLGGSSFIWNTGHTTESIAVTPDMKSTYSVTVVENTCTASGEAVVMVYNNPFTRASSNESFICSGNSVTVYATGGSSYVWNTGETNSSISALITVETTYTVTASNTYGCTASDTVLIHVHNNSPPDAGHYQSICAGDNAILSVSGGGSYLWNNGVTNASISVSPSNSITYTVTVTALSSCTAMDTVSVKVIALPIANAAEDKDICVGDSIAIVATGGGAYLWNIGTTSDAIKVAPTTATNYTVTVYSTTGCSDTDVVQVNVNTLPVVSAGNDIRICKDNPRTLNASPNNALWTYEWSASSGGMLIYETQHNPVVFHSNPGALLADDSVEIYLQVTNENGCSGSDTILVCFEYACQSRVYAYAANNTICLGDSTSIWAVVDTAKNKNIVSLTWSDDFFLNHTTDTTIIAPVTTTTYTVTIIDDVPSVDISSVVIIVNPLPTASAGPDQAICFGKSVNVMGTGGPNYAWSNSQKTASATFTPSTSTAYTLTVANGTTGCSDSDDLIITVNPLPTPGITPFAATICPDASTTLTATGGDTYSWSTSSTTATTNVSPVVAQTLYTVTVTDSNACHQTASALVRLYNRVKVSIGQDLTICIGDQATLTAKGDTLYNYIWNDFSNSTTKTISPTITTTYSLTATSIDAGACTATDEAVVIVNPLPTATIAGKRKICAGEYVSMTASGGTTYNWSDGLGNSSAASQKPNANVTYVVTVTDANGCADDTSFSVVVNQLPLVLLPAIDKTCSSADPVELPEASPAGGIYAGPAANLVNNNLFDPAISGEGAFIITYTFTNDSTNCTNSDTSSILVVPPPTSPLSDQTICEKEALTLTAGDHTRNYLWNNGSTQSSLALVAAASGVSTYTVTISVGDCTFIDEVSVTVNPNPVISRPFNQLICSGEMVTLMTASHPAASTFSWDFGVPDMEHDKLINPTGTYRYTQAGSYDVTIETTVNGCFSTATFDSLVVVNAKPEGSFSFAPKQPTSLFPEVNFSGRSQSAIHSWNWDFGDTNSSENESVNNTNPEHVFSGVGTYTVTMEISDANGCRETSTEKVIVIAEHTLFIPNAFSPNQDGVNDIFQVASNGILENGFSFNIYSRWGEQVYQSTSSDEGWDGTKNGMPSPIGVYSWVLKYVDLDNIPHKKVGMVQLVK